MAGPVVRKLVLTKRTSFEGPEKWKAASEVRDRPRAEGEAAYYLHVREFQCPLARLRLGLDTKDTSE